MVEGGVEAVFGLVDTSVVSGWADVTSARHVRLFIRMNEQPHCVAHSGHVFWQHLLTAWWEFVVPAASMAAVVATGDCAVLGEEVERGIGETSGASVGGS